MERSLEALNQLELSETDTTKKSGVSDDSQKEALVRTFYVLIFTYFLIHLFIYPPISKDFLGNPLNLK